MSKKEFLFILSHYVDQVADNLDIRREFVVYREICRVVEKDPEFEKLVNSKIKNGEEIK